MKNIIIGLVIGFVLNGIVVFAKENILVNPLQKVSGVSSFRNEINTTKVITPDGTYRIFIANAGYGIGITAIRIK